MFLILLLILISLWTGLRLLFINKNWQALFFKQNRPLFYSRKSVVIAPLRPQPYAKHRKKPDWVVREIIKIKALSPALSCRLLAEAFNGQHNHESISKSFVAYTVRNHHYEILQKRRKIKAQPAHAIPFNKVWGMDLTFIDQQPILGVVEHHSRRLMTLKRLKNKASITLLRALLDILEKHEKPRHIRTDDEACFQSRLFKFGLWFLGIKPQTTQVHSPWQNGRIERFFGTLKTHLKALPNNLKTPDELPYLLQSFQFWYNEIRLHQNLDYQTPGKVYRSAQRKQPKQNDRQRKRE